MFCQDRMGQGSKRNIDLEGGKCESGSGRGPITQKTGNHQDDPLSNMPIEDKNRGDQQDRSDKEGKGQNWFLSKRMEET